jgi:hypothetical protein
MAASRAGPGHLSLKGSSRDGRAPDSAVVWPKREQWLSITVHHARPNDLAQWCTFPRPKPAHYSAPLDTSPSESRRCSNPFQSLGTTDSTDTRGGIRAGLPRRSVRETLEQSLKSGV